MFQFSKSGSRLHVVNLFKWLFDLFPSFWEVIKYSHTKFASSVFPLVTTCGGKQTLSHTHTHAGTQVHKHAHLVTVTHWQIKVMCNTPHHTYSSCSDTNAQLPGGFRTPSCVCGHVRHESEAHICTYSTYSTKQQRGTTPAFSCGCLHPCVRAIASGGMFSFLLPCIFFFILLLYSLPLIFPSISPPLYFPYFHSLAFSTFLLPSSPSSPH